MTPVREAARRSAGGLWPATALARIPDARGRPVDELPRIRAIVQGQPEHAVQREAHAAHVTRSPVRIQVARRPCRRRIHACRQPRAFPSNRAARTPRRNARGRSAPVRRGCSSSRAQNRCIFSVGPCSRPDEKAGMCQNASVQCTFAFSSSVVAEPLVLAIERVADQLAVDADDEPVPELSREVVLLPGAEPEVVSKVVAAAVPVIVVARHGQCRRQMHTPGRPVARFIGRRSTVGICSVAGYQHRCTDWNEPGGAGGVGVLRGPAPAIGNVAGRVGDGRGSAATRIGSSAAASSSSGRMWMKACTIGPTEGSGS